ncbi:transmembrane protein 240-like isoform X2 [Plectropomus leopardus]|uniref:transmembrane protein 240-like isoform X2 n=1 Tax=Plectropomus leopardus TaxID=160734 RepID=UPI001C4BBC2A|nr:transmembrane protein 240-like isoform X2 [Plectropomus leopardus]
MNALFDRFHNFILPLVRGEDRVCACTCGRHQVYHVVPYDGAPSTVDSRENYVESDIKTQQEMNVIVGLLLGFCIIVLFWWLYKISHSQLKHWRENQITGFWSLIPKFSNTKEFFRWLHPNHTEDCGVNMLHREQDVCHDAKDT